MVALRKKSVRKAKTPAAKVAKEAAKRARKKAAKKTPVELPPIQAKVLSVFKRTKKWLNKTDISQRLWEFKDLMMEVKAAYMNALRLFKKGLVEKATKTIVDRNGKRRHVTHFRLKR